MKPIKARAGTPLPRWTQVLAPGCCSPGPKTEIQGLNCHVIQNLTLIVYSAGPPSAWRLTIEPCPNRSWRSLQTPSCNLWCSWEYRMSDITWAWSLPLPGEDCQRGSRPPNPEAVKTHHSIHCDQAILTLPIYSLSFPSPGVIPSWGSSSTVRTCIVSLEMFDQTSLKTECAQCSAYTVLRLYTVSSVADLPTQSCDYVRVVHIAYWLCLKVNHLFLLFSPWFENLFSWCNLFRLMRW